MREYLKKLKAELVMSHMSNGWYTIWLKMKIKQIEEALKGKS